MENKPEGLSREDRLAAKLRENLRRRKAQARALTPGAGESDASPHTSPGEGPDDTGALPKAPAKS